MSTLTELTEQILAFRDARNWKQFHSPRNLAAAIAIESGELQELMLWKTDEQVRDLVASTEGKQNLAAEIADVLIFGLLFCETAGIDPVNAIRQKLLLNAEKYPVNLSRNNAKKYTELK